MDTEIILGVVSLVAIIGALYVWVKGLITEGRHKQILGQVLQAIETAAEGNHYFIEIGDRQVDARDAAKLVKRLIANWTANTEAGECLHNLIKTEIEKQD